MTVRIWPRNPWGVPRGLPFLTRWLTKRWHDRRNRAMADGFAEGLARADDHGAARNPLIHREDT